MLSPQRVARPSPGPLKSLLNCFYKSISVQKGLVRAYPDLGWINSKPEQLPELSKREQKIANLNNLTICQMNRICQLNQNYKEKFCFPFVICTRKHQKDEILNAMEHRYKNDQNLELATAIEEILQIAELRIRDIVVDYHDGHLVFSKS